jgi:ribonuclease HI
MVQPTERMFALAERGLPVPHRPGQINDQVRGATGPLLVYTDGSVSGVPIANGLGWMTGWGYLDTSGRYGCGKMPQFAKAGDDLAVVAELRAVKHAIGERLATTACTVITDSAHAARLLADWRTGSDEMPPGYTGRTTRGVPKLELLRRAVATHAANITVEVVKGHAGDVLNEAADTLAQLGMRWGRDALTKPQVRERARGIAEGFLEQWRRR